MLISKEMYEYLTDYMKWIENGGINDEPYYRYEGLCGSVYECKIPNLNLPGIGTELINLFEAEELDVDYPFGKGNYDTRYDDNTQHKDPIRLKWIKDHIKEYENALVNP